MSMRYKLSGVKVHYKHTEADLASKASAILGVPSVKICSILKKSLDARKKDKLMYSYTLVVETTTKARNNSQSIAVYTEPKPYFIPNIDSASKRPVIIGFGPAGMFCGLVLALAGLKPLIFERGEAIDQRISDTNHFFETGELKTESNIQFGEGGAGTFSDGKLSTGIKDRFGRKEFVLNQFVEAGAMEDIRYSNKPHIGTDYLITVVKNIREKIKDLGGSVYFNSQLKDLTIKDNTLKSIQVNEKHYDVEKVVLAIGHSARDTFEMLHDASVRMEQKAFAMGLRIQHPQTMINRSQYGNNADMDYLPVADYKLTYRTKKDRGVYSFCMCPGGYVVNSSSEEGHIVCNGMSNYKRDANNANAAILVNVTPDDFGSEDVLAGVRMQRKWEKVAFEIAGSDYSMPIQTWGDFTENVKSKTLGSIKPSVKGKVSLSNVRECLPSYISEAIIEAVPNFANKIKGFDHKDALVIGIESRSSSPVRIVREEDLQSQIKGLYPCGEGAGYAGGIMSAAIDGIKVAEEIIKYYYKEGTKDTSQTSN